MKENNFFAHLILMIPTIYRYIQSNNQPPKYVDKFIFFLHRVWKIDDGNKYKRNGAFEVFKKKYFDYFITDS